MTFANVQVVDTGAKTDAGTNTRTITLAGATAGNLIVVIADCYGELLGGLGELTISGSGWTLVAYRTDPAIFDNSAFMWAKVAAGGETTITVTITNALRMSLWAAEYSGNDGLNVDGIGSEYSGGNSTAGYVVSHPVPAYQDGLWVGGLFSTANSGGPGTISGTVLHGATQRGNQISHFPSGSLAITGWVYDKVSGSSDAPCDIGGTPTARFGKIGICAVFRAAGASPARAKATGASPATLARLNAGSVGGAGATTLNISGFPAAADGDLLLVGFTIETGRTVTGVPAGWVLYGSVVLAMGTRALTAYVYYKIASAETGGSYSWTFDAATTYGWILNVWHGGSFNPDVAPTYYPAVSSEIFNSGPGTTWSGQIQVGANAVAFTLSRYNGTSGLDTPEVYTGGGSTNPGGGSDFGDKLMLWYLNTSSGGLAQDYHIIGEPGAGHLVQNVEFVNFSFAVAVGSDHWSWTDA